MNNWQIKDLKGVGDVELSLDSNQRVFTFLGANGVGKTKTLEAICIALLMVYVQNYQPSPAEINEKAVIFHNIDISDERFQFETITYGFRDFDAIPPQLDVSKPYSALAYLGASQRSDINGSASNGHSIRVLPPKNVQQISNVITQSIFNGSFKKIGMNENIHDWFTERAKSVNPYQIEEDNHKSDIDAVLEALHILDNRFSKILNINISGEVFLTVENKKLELSELSSGFLSLVKIIQSIIASFSAFTNEKDLLNVKGVVLIDEIESHLHLEWQVKIIPILKNLFPNTTFYITTHSPLVLSQLNEGEAYLLKRDDDNVVRSHLINSPNTRLLENVLQDAFGVNLNELKRQNMANIDQSKAKKKLLDLLN